MNVYLYQKVMKLGDISTWTDEEILTYLKYDPFFEAFIGECDESMLKELISKFKQNNGYVGVYWISSGDPYKPDTPIIH